MIGMSLGPPQVGDWREGADGAAVHGQDQIPDLLGPGGPQLGGVEVEFVVIFNMLKF